MVPTYLNGDFPFGMTTGLGLGLGQGNSLGHPYTDERAGVRAGVYD